MFCFPRLATRMSAKISSVLTMSLPELPLSAAIGFAGSIKNGFLLHPDGQSQIYPLGAAVVISKLARRDAEEAPGKGHEKSRATFLHGHLGSVTAIAVSTSGRLIASGERVAGGVADIIVWELRDAVSSCTYAVLRRLSLHVGEVTSLEFSADESAIVSVGGEQDNRIIMWDVLSGNALCGSPAPVDGKVRAVAFLHHSNTRFITAGEMTTSTWEYDATSKRLQFETVKLGILKRDILSIAIDEDDAYAYLGTSSADILCVSIPNRVIKESFTLKKHISRGVCSLIVVRGGLLAGGGDGSLSLMARERGSCVLKFVACRALGVGAVMSVAVSRSPQSDVMGLEYPKTCKTEYSKRKYVHEALFALAHGNGMPDDYRDASQTFNVYCATSSGELHLTEYCAQHPLTGKCMLLRGSVCQESSHAHGIIGIAFPRNDDQYFATGGGSEVIVWETRAAKSSLKIQVSPRSLKCTCVSFMPNGEVILSGWDDGKIRAHDRTTGELLFVAAGAHTRVTALRGMKESSGIISGGSEGNVRLWKVLNNNVITLEASMKEHRSAVNDIALLNDDNSAVTASDDGSCVVWDLTRRVRQVSFFGSTYFKAIGVHPDEQQIVTTGTDRKITWWDPADASVLRVIDDPADVELTALAVFQPDGDLIAVAGSDRIIKIFDYETGELTHVSARHAAPVSAVSVAPGGRFVVSVSADGAVLIWSNPATAFVELKQEKERHIARVLTGELDDDALEAARDASRGHSAESPC